MNLWLRLIGLVVASFFRPRLDPARDVSRLSFRVWPHDLDVSMHMNNGRYWTLMDLGRLDLMVRSGAWRAVLRHGWTPVVSAGTIRFRRELKAFRAFTLETRMVAWTETWFVSEHRILTTARDGSEILAAVALLRAGLYDRKAKAFVPIERLFQEVGVAPMPSPAASAEVQAFIAAEDALKRAA